VRQAGLCGDEVCLDVAGDTTVRFGGSAAFARVYSISGDQGVLRVSDLDSGGLQGGRGPRLPGGNDRGDPLESQRRVFVPDFTTGADTSCSDGGTPGILGATAWASATDMLGKVSRSASVRLS
jgi:hypothetical protein